MRQIKARDILPGMTIRWSYGDVSYQCTLARVERFNDGQDVQGETRQHQTVLIHGDKDVVVVNEPPQPQEPTEFGAKVRVRDGRFVRLGDGDLRYHVWHEEGTGYQWTWDQLCARGPVTVVPDQGWTVPADTPKVPERIEEWPESDEHLRKHPWRDRDGDTWTWAEAQAEWECRDHRGVRTGASSRPSPRHAPWTRVDDSLEPQEPVVPERIEEWGTWEDVPEGVAVSTPGLLCHYRKNQGVAELRDPKGDPGWTEFGFRYMSRRYGPWTRVTDA